jgi:hypothetical protein
MFRVAGLFQPRMTVLEFVTTAPGLMVMTKLSCRNDRRLMGRVQLASTLS